MALVVSEETFDPTLSKLRQVQDLQSPNSTPRCLPSSPSSEERWADIAVDSGGYEAAEEDSGLFLESVEEMDSVGSKQHDSGRCKPCAFYHTKGCQSGANCQFCHRCPAHEKQRRKRLRRQLCNSLMHGFDGRGRGQGDRISHPKKAGHARISSHMSDTTSTCSGWVSNSDGHFGHSANHSRHPSTSSQATSIYEIGDSGNMANLRYVRSQNEPVYYQNTQPQLMSSQMDYQNVMRPMEESWSETPQHEVLDNMPALEAQALSAHERAFPSSGDVLNSMPQMPAGEILSQKEPPPPPSGVPKVSDTCLQQRPAQLRLPVGGGGAVNNFPREQAHMSPVSSPVGYINCGGYQYAIVPVPQGVPLNQYEMDATTSPMHLQEQMPSPMHHQQAGQQFFHMEQSWDTMPYQCVQEFPTSPVAVGTVMGGSQWW
jgi:hypothetical protein